MAEDAGKQQSAEPDREADARLLRRLRQRDRDALEGLARGYSEALSRAAFLYLGDAHAAADVAQDALLAAWDGAKRVDHDTALRPWLFGILFNLCRKEQRTRVRRRRRERQAAERARRARSDASSPPPDDRLGRLREALERLEDGFRAVVVLRYGQGLSVAETAAALNIPEGTVKSRTHTALRRLRTEVSKGDA